MRRERTRRQLQMIQGITILRRRHETHVVSELRAFFRGQAERVVADYLRRYGLAVKATVLPDGEDERLARLLLGPLTASAADLTTLTGGFVNAPPLEPNDPQVLRIYGQVAARVSGINATTERAIRDVIVRGQAAGYTPEEIAYGLTSQRRDAGGRFVPGPWRGLKGVVEETYSGRSVTIAMTETARITNLGSVNAYARAGLSLVDVADGEECGWLFHDDEDLADGSTRTIDEAEAAPLAHPRCQRMFLPYTGDSREES